jgi:aryl-alcohol dehydrogenase-like predicted oxidoreductase
MMYLTGPASYGQMEYSPFDLEIETNGLLDAARDTGVAVVAYSPLGRGLLTGRWVRRFVRTCRDSLTKAHWQVSVAGGFRRGGL